MIIASQVDGLPQFTGKFGKVVTKSQAEEIIKVGCCCNAVYINLLLVQKLFGIEISAEPLEAVVAQFGEKETDDAIYWIAAHFFGFRG